MDIIIVKDKIKLDDLKHIAENQFVDLVKAVVDVKQGIMAVGGELHSDEEVSLMELEGSKRENTWGINLYPHRFDKEDWIEFDSIVNIKPSFGNRSRYVEDPKIKEKIKEIIKNLVVV